jgi:hypothetical protein
MTRRPVPILAVLAVLVAAAGLTGCSASGGAAAGPSPSASADPAQLLELGKRFAQCGRDHGYPDIPDPHIDGGYLVWPDDGGPDLKERMRTLSEQVPECRVLLDQITAKNERRNNETPGPADLPKLQAFAKCMREHGIDGFPDPKPDGSFPLAGTPLESEGKSERVLTALDACKSIYDKRIVIS